MNIRIPTHINYTNICPTNLKQRFKVKLGLNVGKLSPKLGKKAGKRYPLYPPNYQLVNFQRPRKKDAVPKCGALDWQTKSGYVIKYETDIKRYLE